MDIVSFILVFLGLLFLGMPIAFVMLVSSAAYFLLSGSPIFIKMLPERVFAGIDVFVLMAIPFFLLTGEIMNRAKMTDRLFDFCNMLIGRVRGGLAQVNVLASVMFSGVTGVALGDIASLGKMFIPAMVRQGYDSGFTSAVTAASSLIGAIIPPSTIIIVYAAVMNVSVGAMFSAAIIPGLMLAVGMMGLVQYLSWKRKYPKVHVEVTPRKLALGFRDAFFAILMPVIIIRGIIIGWFTPTEAAAVCVGYATVVGVFFLRTISFRDFNSILSVATLDTARLFFIIAGASAMSWVFAIENVPVVITSLFEGISENQIVVVLLINLFFLICGMWLDASISIILFAPVVAPLAYSVGLHPVQLGIMLIVNCVLGLITPPVGNVILAVANISRISILRLSVALLPFVGLGLVCVILIGLWGDLTLLLPRAFGLLNP